MPAKNSTEAGAESAHGWAVILLFVSPQVVNNSIRLKHNPKLKTMLSFGLGSIYNTPPGRELSHLSTARSVIIVTQQHSRWLVSSSGIWYFYQSAERG